MNKRHNGKCVDFGEVSCSIFISYLNPHLASRTNSQVIGFQHDFACSSIYLDRSRSRNHLTNLELQIFKRA